MDGCCSVVRLVIYSMKINFKSACFGSAFPDLSAPEILKPKKSWGVGYSRRFIGKMKVHLLFG